MKSSDQSLADFDHTVSIKLICDASKLGIGAVISLGYPDGTEET